MKKYLLLIGVIISIGILAFASKSAFYMDIAKRSRSDKYTTVRRTPMQFPEDVSFHKETHPVEVVGDEELVAQVFLCDENGNTLDYSSCINAFMDVPSNYSSFTIIRTECEDWTVTGKITI